MSSCKLCAILTSTMNRCCLSNLKIKWKLYAKLLSNETVYLAILTCSFGMQCEDQSMIEQPQFANQNSDATPNSCKCLLQVICGLKPCSSSKFCAFVQFTYMAPTLESAEQLNLPCLECWHLLKQRVKWISTPLLNRCYSRMYPLNIQNRKKDCKQLHASTIKFCILY